MANGELELLPIEDPVTGLCSREPFGEVLEREWRRCARDRSPLSLLLLDVDHFKRFTDRYGRQAGDDCLRRIAGALKGVVRRSGDVVARHGGEAFTVLLPATDENGARVVAELCRGNVSTLQIPHEDSDVDSCVTISIGVCTLQPDRGDDAASIIERAERALCMARQSGRNCVVVQRGAGVGQLA